MKFKRTSVRKGLYHGKSTLSCSNVSKTARTPSIIAGKKGRITRVRVESDRREVEKTRIWRTFNQALSPGCNDGGTKARIWRTFVDQVLSKWSLNMHQLVRLSVYLRGNKWINFKYIYIYFSFFICYYVSYSSVAPPRAHGSLVAAQIPLCLVEGLTLPFDATPPRVHPSSLVRYAARSGDGGESDGDIRLG
jgi:hypothetical protein